MPIETIVCESYFFQGEEFFKLEGRRFSVDMVDKHTLKEIKKLSEGKLLYISRNWGTDNNIKVVLLLPILEKEVAFLEDFYSVENEMKRNAHNCPYSEAEAEAIIKGLII